MNPPDELRKAVLQVVAKTIGIENMTVRDFAFLDSAASYALNLHVAGTVKAWNAEPTPADDDGLPALDRDHEALFGDEERQNVGYVPQPRDPEPPPLRDDTDGDAETQPATLSTLIPAARDTFARLVPGAPAPAPTAQDDTTTEGLPGTDATMAETLDTRPPPGAPDYTAIPAATR